MKYFEKVFFSAGRRDEGRGESATTLSPGLRGRFFAAEPGEGRRLPFGGGGLVWDGPAALGGTASFLRQDCAERVWAGAAPERLPPVSLLRGKGSFPPCFRGDVRCLFFVCVTSGRAFRKQCSTLSPRRGSACSGRRGAQKCLLRCVRKRRFLCLPGR